MDQNPQFNEAYWLHQPPEVRKLRTINDDNERAAVAQALAQRGYIVDPAIMIWGQDPYREMLQRNLYGFTWVPSAGQAAVPLIPGFNEPPGTGLLVYDSKHPPRGSILVSINIADFPPIDPPPPPPNVPTPSSYVGRAMQGGFYISLPGDDAVAGTVREETRGKFVYRTGPIGGWYEKIG